MPTFKYLSAVQTSSKFECSFERVNISNARYFIDVFVGRQQILNTTEIDLESNDTSDIVQQEYIINSQSFDIRGDGVSIVIFI